MERPTLEDSRKTWLSQPIITRESAYSIYSKEQDKFIDFQQSEINRLKEEANEVDHADYCMCRYCNPEFHELKKSQNKH